MKKLSRPHLATALVMVLLAWPLNAIDAGAQRTHPDTRVPARDGLFDSTWPYGRSDSWRTSAVVGGAGLPKDFLPASLRAKVARIPQVPFWGVTSSRDLCPHTRAASNGKAIYILGGSPLLMRLFSFASSAHAGPAATENRLDPAFLEPAGPVVDPRTVQPYIVRIDSRSMRVTGLARLPRDRTINYTGDLVLHANGMLYAVATSTVYQVDPCSMAVTATRALPRYESQSFGTVYNSLLVSPRSGDLIAKGVSLFDPSQPAKLVALRASDLAIRHEAAAPIAATRVTVAAHDDTEYVYASNNTQTTRVALDDAGFHLDEAWSETYRSIGDGTTGGIGMTYMGDQDFVVFPNNNTVIYGITQPMQLYTKATDTTAETLQYVNATSSIDAGGSFYSVAADPYHTGIIVIHDQINNNTAAWVGDDDGTLTKLWETARYATAAGAAIASDQEHLYMGDRRCAGPGLRRCRLYLVVLDLTTGEHLGELRVAGSVPTLGEIFVGDDAVFFISSQAGRAHGYITRITASRGRRPGHGRRLH